ncbi:glucarate dehydratase [Agrobacterium tumefaciens]|nr:glucarate dehydratase [Agrobacterium tumefaciens]
MLSDHHYWGGLRAASHLSKICEVLDLGLSMHSNSHLGITLAAMVHAAAATPNLTFDCDTHYPWTATDVIEGTPFIFRDGKLALPTKPGLGVSLDRNKLASLAALYDESSLKERDDTAYMKLFDPDYTRRVPRW